MKHISAKELHSLLETDKIELIDVRESDEFANGHVAGARNLPLSSLADNYSSLDKEVSYRPVPPQLPVRCRRGAGPRRQEHRAEHHSARRPVRLLASAATAIRTGRLPSQPREAAGHVERSARS